MFKKTLSLLVCLLLTVSTAFGQSEGESIIRDGYEFIHIAGSCVAGFRYGNKIGIVLLCSDMTVVEAPIYDDIEQPIDSDDNNQMILVGKGNKWGAYDSLLLKEAIECLYSMETARRLAIEYSMVRDRRIGRTWKMRETALKNRK